MGREGGGKKEKREKRKKERTGGSKRGKGKGWFRKGCKDWFHCWRECGCVFSSRL